MLPTTLVVISVMTLFLVHQCLSSPVYTMQPAYITANIGASTGRNIRRLPCVSRKSGMTGTCMFAIDCLKANGTHLGTCIDRFYFGSCCHIEPVNDLSDNVIDTAIMPDRQPPYRMSSSTTERASVPANTTIPAKTTTFTTRMPDTSIATNTPKTVITITRKPLPSVGVGTTEKFITSQKISTQGTITKPTVKPISDTISTIKETKVATTTESYKLSTFQSVDDGTEPTTVKVKPSTIKPTTTTSKPVSTKPKPRPTVKPLVVHTTKPTQSRPTVTTKPSTKPIIKPTTKIPVTRPGTVKPTVKPTRITTTTTSSPIKTSTTVKPVKVITTKRPVLSTKPSTTQKITTTKPITTKITTTAKPVKTTAKPITNTTNIPSTTKLPDSIVEETRPESASSFISNEVLVTSSTKVPLIETVNGNTATNEIESIEQPTPEKSPDVVITTEKPTTQMQGLVTWAMINNHEQTTKVSINISNEDPEDEWTPITPPDGWVLLPSVSTTTQQITNDTPTTVASATHSTIPPQSTTTTTTIKDDDTTSQTTSLPISTTAINSSSDNKTTETLELVPLLNISTSASTQQTTPTPSSVMPTDETMSTIIPTPKPVNMSDHTDVCGRRMYPEPRIVGGEKSTFGKWPWQISLRQWKTSTYLHKCGAALLNENWAITAAHCVENVPPSDLLLRLGEHDLSTDSEPYIHQERRVQIVASHPQFDPRTFEYDLALLRFYEPVQFQPNIIPVCVPQDDESFVGRNAHVTGWGRLYEDGPLPSVLQEVSVPVINNTVCESMYRNAGYIEHIPNIFICAGWKHGGFDSCEGDSGGPMVIQRPDKRYLLAGIISWGIGCAEPNQPGVYTRISEFRDWINQILQF